MSEALHLLAGAYAVDALDPDERAEFEAHLAGCPECTEQVRELQATAARLASAEAVVPPPALRASVLAAAARTEQERPAAEVVPLDRDRERRTVRVLAVAAAVLAVVAVGLGVLLVQARSDRSALAARQQQLTEVIAAADVRTSSGDVAGGGRAAVVVSDSRQQAAFVGAGLAAPSSGHVYELWFIGSDGKAVPAGTFDPGPDGNAAVLMQGDPAGAAVVGVTVEPEGGSAQPTTKPIVVVPISG
jgi:anti-sigma-K factor RskA